MKHRPTYNVLSVNLFKQPSVSIYLIYDKFYLKYLVWELTCMFRWGIIVYELLITVFSVIY